MSQTRPATGAPPVERDAPAVDSDETGPVTRELTPRASPIRRYGPPAVSLVVYLLLASALYGGHSWVSTTHITGCACGDQVQEVWFLSWPPYALSHIQNLFYSGWLNYPAGVNLADNTSMPLLGVLGTPVTLLIGPVATYNLLLRLAFALSAFSMCLVLRRWTSWWPAAFVGGLIYGFSPYMVGQGYGHLFLIFVPIPPLIVLMMDEIVVRRRWSPRRSGAVLGLLIVAQFLISPEILIMTVVAVGIGLAIAAVARFREVGAVFRHAAEAVGWSVGVSLVLLAYPAWVIVAGPQHVVGPPHPIADLNRYPGDLIGILAPTYFMRFGPTSLIAIGTKLTGGDIVENGLYLGLPLLVTLVCFVIAYRKRAALVLASAVAFCTWILSLGAHLTMDRTTTSVPLPYDILSHIPFLQDLLPPRFSLLTALFVAATLAMGLDMLWSPLAGEQGRRPRPAHRAASAPSRGRRWAASGLVVVLAGIVAVPLFPRSPYPAVPTEVPTLFTSPALTNIPTGSVVLTYPYPVDPELKGMLDQAVAGMHFKIVGSSAFIPGPGGRANLSAQFLPPLGLQALFYSAFTGGPVQSQYQPPLAQTVSTIRTFLSTYRISTVVLHPVGADPGKVVRYMTASIGAPTHVGGVTQWFDVPARLRQAAAGPAP